MIAPDTRRAKRRSAVQAGKGQNCRKKGSNGGCFVLPVVSATSTGLPFGPGAWLKRESGE